MILYTHYSLQIKKNNIRWYIKIKFQTKKNTYKFLVSLITKRVSEWKTLGTGLDLNSTFTKILP